MFKDVAKDSLAWLPERGVGFYPVTANVYDAVYFERYRKMAAHPMGLELTRARVRLVLAYYHGSDFPLDVGIGSGQFIESMKGAYGYDVNPDAVKWLKTRGAYRDPYDTGRVFEAMTFWDSLEHIGDPRAILSHVGTWAFVSMPIYTGLDHLLRSKHFRKDEHFWYFTEGGLIQFFDSEGFVACEVNDSETEIGREDIKSFVFRRKSRG